MSGMTGVTEIIHGVEVQDPYRWLERRKLPETEAWLRRQRNICDEYFLRSHRYHSLLRTIRATLSVDLIDQAARVGGYLFLRKQGRAEEQASIRVCTDNGAAERVLVGPDALGSGISVEILHISRDASFLAYGVRSSGTDALEVHVVDVRSGIILPDHLPLGYGRGFRFDRQGLGFYYAMEPIQRTDSLSIRHHRFGTELAEDTVLFTIPWEARSRLILLGNDSMLGALVTNSVSEEMAQALFVMKDAPLDPWKPVCEHLKKAVTPLIAHGRMFLIERDDPRSGRVLELCDGHETQRVVVPERPGRIRRCAVTDGGLVVSYVDHGLTRVEHWSTDGEFIGDYRLPGTGSIEVLPTLAEKVSSIFFLHESYTEAPTLWEINLGMGASGVATPLSHSEENLSATIREFRYSSLDGTNVPMTLIEPQGDGQSGIRPVVLVGYGGFGAAEKPRFSRFTKVMLEFGVTVARAGIRGGSEFGEEWHQAAVGRKRQTSIDDFVAAAEWLQSEGITDEQHLAIMGSSNGGLLVAAAAVQRPELFKAVVCTGPLTDMVRYEHFDRAAKWRSEYGTWEDLEDFRALLSYSPYHNVKDMVDYPSMLVVSGDADDRCNPAHARKIVAALQERVGQRHPILLDYAENWGHVPTLTLTERVHLLARKIAFLCEQLDVTDEGGARHGVPVL